MLIQSSCFHTLALGVCALITFSAPAAADDAPFLTADPASIVAEGEFDVVQWFSWGSGHQGESYQSFGSVTEFDYGVSDRMQVALSLLYDWSRARPPGGPADATSLPGVAAEAIYVLLPTDTSPIGLALATDAAVNAQSRGFAVRLLMTKYFGGFENVLNINFDNCWEKDGTGHWDAGSGIAFNYGLGYAVDENWTVALELGNDFAFDELLGNSRMRSEASTFYLGPTVQYDCEAVVVTLGAQAQLPWSSGDNVVDGFTADADSFRVGLRVAWVI